MAVWWQAIRPKTLWAAVSPVAVGAILAADASALFVPGVLLALAAALLLQIGTNLHNDYADFASGADTAERTGPLRVTQSGLLKPNQVRAGYVAALGLAAAVAGAAALRGGVPIVILGVVSILSALAYTGGPAPLGYLGLGELFVLLFFGFAAVAGTYYLSALMVTPVVVLAGLGPGLLASAILVVNNLRDRPTDKLAGKRTLAVRLGDRFARVEYAVCIGLALLATPAVLVVVSGKSWLAALPSLTLIPALPLLRQVLGRASGFQLNSVLAATSRLQVIYAALFAVGWLLA